MMVAFNATNGKLVIYAAVHVGSGLMFCSCCAAGWAMYPFVHPLLGAVVERKFALQLVQPQPLAVGRPARDSPPAKLPPPC